MRGQEDLTGSTSPRFHHPSPQIPSQPSHCRSFCLPHLLPCLLTDPWLFRCLIRGEGRERPDQDQERSHLERHPARDKSQQVRTLREEGPEEGSKVREGGGKGREVEALAEERKS